MPILLVTSILKQSLVTGDTITCGSFVIQSWTAALTVGVILVGHLCFLIVQKNDFIDFTYLIFLVRSINLGDAVDFDMPKCEENSFNESIALLFWIHSLCGLFLFKVELYKIDVPVIPIPVQCLSSSWYFFIPYYFYNLSIWLRKLTLNSLV